MVVGEGCGGAQSLVDLGADAGEGAASGGGELAVAVDVYVQAAACEDAAALAYPGAGDVEFEAGGCVVQAQVLGLDVHVELFDEQVVAQRDAEFGVCEEDSGLSDCFGGDQGVVAAVDAGEEAVSAGPLGGEGEPVAVQALPAGEQDVGGAGAVDEFFGDGGGQGRLVVGCGGFVRGSGVVSRVCGGGGGGGG